MKSTGWPRLVGAGAAFAAALLLAAPAPAQKAVPATRAAVEASYAPLVKKAAPAVVNVFSRRVVRQARSPLLEDPFFRRFFGEDAPLGQPSQRIQSSLGSGVILRSDGVILTNHHVIKDAAEITVALADRREFEAKLVLADERTDLAVLKIDVGGEPLPALELRDSDEVEVGDLVLAIGNPFGVGQTVTSGIVSALARTQVGITDLRFFIQTDAAINPGNSGGALVTMDGKLAGINTAIFSRTGGSLGIGFAIPANMVGVVLKAAMAGGRVKRPWLGAGGQPVTQDLAASLGLERPGGVIVNSIQKGSPAEKGGLRVGDVILAIDGYDIIDPGGLAYRIATRQVGSAATFAIVRNKTRTTLKVALTEPPEDPPRDEAMLEGRHPLAGATVVNLSPAVADEIGFAGAATGVVVLKVAAEAPAARFGVKPEDVIVEVNGIAIGSVAALRAAVARPAPTWRLAIRRGERLIAVTIQG